jgi:hypothetical protein
VLLIIVGAGASFDSDWRRPREVSLSSYEWDGRGKLSRPPLAKDLFDDNRFGEYVARYPPSQGLMDRLRRAAPAVEQELEKIRDLSKKQGHLPRMLLAVRYYLRIVIADTVGQWNKAKPDEMTNFTQLLTQLEPWRLRQERDSGSPERVAIVTFNYDTLFDDALTHLLPHFPLTKVENYTSDPRYQLFKLHGSVNWWREVRGHIVGNQQWTSGQGLIGSPVDWARTMFDPPGEFTENGRFLMDGSGGLYPPCVPCIALPTATKAASDFACPDTHVADLMRLLREVTDVLIIGWKGIEGHFLEGWRQVHASTPDRTVHSLAVVDATHEAAVEVANRIVRTVGIAPQMTPTFQTFSGFVVDRLDHYLQETLGHP